MCDLYGVVEDDVEEERTPMLKGEQSMSRRMATWWAQVRRLIWSELDSKGIVGWNSAQFTRAGCDDAINARDVMTRTGNGW